MFPKRKPWRSPKYLAWIREQECSNCINPNGKTQAHHLIGVGNLGGMGTKAPDWAAMPMCVRCHGEIHYDPDMWDEQWEMIARTLGRAIDDEAIGLLAKTIERAVTALKNNEIPF